MLTHKTYKKVVLVILDGFGVASPSRGNAVTLATTPNLDWLISQYPHATLQASGPLVGLPFGEPGNSEVGHLSIGSGRIVGQDLLRINKAIESGDFFRNEAFIATCLHVKKHNSQLHLVGLVSDGGVHSSNEHLYALLGLAQKNEIEKVFVHFFSDGRDAPPQHALSELGKLELKMRQIGAGKVATVTGRFYAMDRGGHWQQTLFALDAMVNGNGIPAISAVSAIENAYQNGLNDEMIPPTVIINPDTNEAVGKMQNNDAVIFFNFRQDRMVQLATAFAIPGKIPAPSAINLPPGLFFVTMTEYVPLLPVQVVFPTVTVKNHLSSILSQNGLSQLHAAETEKYAHVTMFFNCGQADLLSGEERIIIDSPKDNSANYANVPEMSARRLTDEFTRNISQSQTNFFVVNFANADMVGHTGNLKAGIAAVKILDECIGRVAKTCLEVDACLIITADHGNIEQMLDLKSGVPDTDHTSNPVPLIMVANEWKFTNLQVKTYKDLAAMVPVGMIADIAPTILELIGIPVPTEMRSVSLLQLVKN